MTDFGSKFSGRTVALCALLLSALAWSAYTWVVKPMSDTEFGRDQSNKTHFPLRLMIVSSLDESDRRYLLEEIDRYDVENSIDTSYLAMEYDEVDIVLNVLDSWDDVQYMPMQDSLKSVYHNVRETPANIIRKTIEYQLGDGRVMVFIFYNRSVGGDMAIPCYAKDFVDNLGVWSSAAAASGFGGC